MLMDPVNRGSAWRKGFNTPTNYDDNGNYCGGYTVQHSKNGGKCGVCGDNYALKQPRPYENGGLYGTGEIVKEYTVGQKFTAIVQINANHKGYFKFDLCPLKESDDIETDECFDDYPVLTINGTDKYVMKKIYTGKYEVPLVLPDNLVCDHCSFRWTYVAANNWGICGDGTGKDGCGPQETFRTCSDIKIVDKKSTKESFEKSIEQSIKESSKKSIEQSTKESSKKSIEQSIKESSKKSMEQSTKESSKKSIEQPTEKLSGDSIQELIEELSEEYITSEELDCLMNLQL
ncbi:hypothetical protein PV325_002155 [Microctonus aethiopoides]|nr:hypothetical protein PV325_002155 [Microctonus aethiopoides]